VRDVNRDGRPAFALAALYGQPRERQDRTFETFTARRYGARICPRELFAYIRIRLDSRQRGSVPRARELVPPLCGLRDEDGSMEERSRGDPLLGRADARGYRGEQELRQS